MRRPRLQLLLLAAAIAAGASCGGEDEVAGGAADLPGPVPEGVSFAPPPASAPAAPAFTAALVDGTSVRVSDLWRERPLVLVFTASWCVKCADVHRRAAAVVGRRDGAVALLGVVPADDAGGAVEYAKRLSLGHPVAAASDRVWLSYAAREPPVVVLVAQGGKVLRGWPGGADVAVLERAVDALFAR